MNRPDTDTHCHCSAAYDGSDHCPVCACEQYESGDCGLREVWPQDITEGQYVRTPSGMWGWVTTRYRTDWQGGEQALAVQHFTAYNPLDYYFTLSQRVWVADR